MIRVRPIAVADTRKLRQALLRPNRSLEDLASHELAGSFAVGAYADGDQLIAVAFVCPDGGPGAWRVRGMATLPAARGSGAGCALLAALVDHALDRGAERVWCNARIKARTLYERAGFRVISEEFEIPEIGPHLVMELHPEAVRSP